MVVHRLKQHGDSGACQKNYRLEKDIRGKETDVGCVLRKTAKLRGNYEDAADCRDITNLGGATVCAGSTTKSGQVEGRRTKGRQHYPWE